MFNIKKRILFLCFVIYACLAVGINPKRHFGECFFILKEKKFSVPSSLQKGFKA